MNDSIQLLDCTLRDGGQGLEDSFYSGYGDKNFDNKTKGYIIDNLINSKIEIIELGSIKSTDEDRSIFACYRCIEDLAKTMPKYNRRQLFAALYTGPDTDLDDIPEWNESLPQVVRVILRYSELQKSLDFCAGLAKKNYKVFIQPMLTMRYTDDEIQMLIKAANEMNAYALYIVDSYGYMKAEDVHKLAQKYDYGLNPSVRIGFHSHNNMNLAFANTMEFLGFSKVRKIIIDSTLIGIGQGAGNLQTEVITDYLNKNYNKEYNYGAVLSGCELVDTIAVDNLWGYSVSRLLPAINKTAYKYALALRYKYKLSYEEINRLLANIPDNLRHRYTVENTELLVKLNDINVKD